MTKVVAEESLGKSEPGQPFQARVGGIHDPDDAQCANFAGIVLQLELEAGNGRDDGCARTPALRANRLTWNDFVTTSAAEHGCSGATY